MRKEKKKEWFSKWTMANRSFKGPSLFFLILSPLFLFKKNVSKHYLQSYPLHSPLQLVMGPLLDWMILYQMSFNPFPVSPSCHGHTPRSASSQSLSPQKHCPLPMPKEKRKTLLVMLLTIRHFCKYSGRMLRVLPTHIPNTISLLMTLRIPWLYNALFRVQD